MYASGDSRKNVWSRSHESVVTRRWPVAGHCFLPGPRIQFFGTRSCPPALPPHTHRRYEPTEPPRETTSSGCHATQTSGRPDDRSRLQRVSHAGDPSVRRGCPHRTGRVTRTVSRRGLAESLARCSRLTVEAFAAIHRIPHQILSFCTPICVSRNRNVVCPYVFSVWQGG